MGHSHGDCAASRQTDQTATAHDRDYSRRPLVVTWELTQACALACSHCRADASPDRHPDELSTAQAHVLFDQVAAFGDPAPFFVF
jgi:Predicted Fe-S oxidoreductases